MIAVKICGITSLKDAEMAVNYSVPAIGLIFYPDSLRYVDPAKVEQWIHRIPDSVKKVGVFVNEQIDTINNITRQLKLEFIQLHGDESPEFCNEMIRPVIKVFRVGDDFETDVKLDIFSKTGKIHSQIVPIKNQTSKVLGIEDALSSVGYKVEKGEILWCTLESDCGYIDAYYLTLSNQGFIGGDHSF